MIWDDSVLSKILFDLCASYKQGDKNLLKCPALFPSSPSLSFLVFMQLSVPNLQYFPSRQNILKQCKRYFKTILWRINDGIQANARLVKSIFSPTHSHTYVCTVRTNCRKSQQTGVRWYIESEPKWRGAITCDENPVLVKIGEWIWGKCRIETLSSVLRKTDSFLCIKFTHVQS